MQCGDCHQRRPPPPKPPPGGIGSATAVPRRSAGCTIRRARTLHRRSREVAHPDWTDLTRRPCEPSRTAFTTDLLALYVYGRLLTFGFDVLRAGEYAKLRAWRAESQRGRDIRRDRPGATRRKRAVAEPNDMPARRDPRRSRSTSLAISEIPERAVSSAAGRADLGFATQLQHLLRCCGDGTVLRRKLSLEERVDIRCMQAIYFKIKLHHDLPKSKAARCRAIGKLTSCCLLIWPRLSRSVLHERQTRFNIVKVQSIEKPALPLGPSPGNSASFHKQCTKPSASTTEPSLAEHHRLHKTIGAQTFFCRSP